MLLECRWERQNLPEWILVQVLGCESTWTDLCTTCRIVLVLLFMIQAMPLCLIMASRTHSHLVHCLSYNSSSPYSPHLTTRLNLTLQLTLGSLNISAALNLTDIDAGVDSAGPYGRSRDEMWPKTYFHGIYRKSSFGTTRVIVLLLTPHNYSTLLYPFLTIYEHGQLDYNTFTFCSRVLVPIKFIKVKVYRFRIQDIF